MFKFVYDDDNNIIYYDLDAHKTFIFSRQDLISYFYKYGKHLEISIETFLIEYYNQT